MTNGKIIPLIWAILLLGILAGLLSARWSLSFVAAATIGISLLPSIFATRFQIQLPIGFITAILLFVFGTLFLGEAFDFYERYWWWDVLLHGGSAIGFGLTGFLFVFMLFHGNKYAAPPSALAFIAACLGLAMGTLWEIFEFAVDQLVGLNMQKSGLMDTMSDLIVDTMGASVGALAGYFYLRGWYFAGLSDQIDVFVKNNRRFFKKLTRRPRD